MPRSEELAVQAGEAVLAGTLALPDGPPPDSPGRYPAALLLPSWLPRTRDGSWDRVGHPSWFAAAAESGPGLLARLAEALAEHGVASLRCDPRGCGTSEGTWEAASLFARIDDARDMVAAMRGDRRLDLRRTAIVGHGEGATLALSVAIGDPAVSALSLVGAAARSWRDVARRAMATRRRTGADRQHPIVRALDRVGEEIIERAERREVEMPLRLPGGEVVQLQLAGIEQAIHTPGLALATMLHRSVALVHGELDAWANPDESRLLAAALAEAGNQPALTIVPQAGHDLAEGPDSEIDRLAADLAARISPAELPPVLLAIEEMDRGVR